MMGAVTAAPTTRHRRRGARVAALLTAAALALSACTSPPMDHAATVNGQVISETDLHEATAQFNTVSQQPVVPGQVLNVLAQLPVLSEMASGAGAPITDHQLLTEVRGVGIEEPNQLLLDYVRGLVYLQTVGGQVPPEQLTGLDVEINPRYGSWDPERAAVVPQVPDWITTGEVES